MIKRMELEKWKKERKADTGVRNGVRKKRRRGGEGAGIFNAAVAQQWREGAHAVMPYTIEVIKEGTIEAS